ncbi:MAG: aldehyde dehydrogenase family protein [Thermoplasmata archaeon]
MPDAPLPGPWIDNAYLPPDGRPRMSVVDPADGSTVGTLSAATADDARAAIDSAHRAQSAWEAMGAAARGAILLRAAERMRAGAEDLARLITREMGKVLHESRGEVAGAIDNLEYYPSFARTLTGEEVAGLPHGETMRLVWLPRGVVVAITPWNFPAATVTRKIAPALLGGNTMVLKPSSNTPLSSLWIARCLADAGLPPGVLNVVPGPGASLGPALIGHRHCSTVTLTGSTASGVEVLRLAAPGVVKCLLELGGKAPVLVAPDADLSRAARATVFARFWNAGQACIAAERALVAAPVAPAFVREVTQLTRALRVGPGLSPGVDIGPLYSRAARDAVDAAVHRALDGGARVATGGIPPKGPAFDRGAFYEPTVLDEVPPDAPIAQEEIFGPVLPVSTYEDFDEALALVNESRYGLSSYLFTRDLARAERAVRGLRYGETYINRAGPESPQGYHAGFRQSGLGGEGTVWGVRDYLQLKTVYVDWREHPVPDGFPYPG